jgi:cytochrome c oxidase subunit II
MKRDFFLATLLWIVLTVLGMILVLQTDLFPLSAAHEADIIDEAFRLLTVLGIPVFTFVLAGLIYSVIRFKHSGETPQDGPPIRTSQTVTWAWLGITSALAVFIIFNPGLKGIRELTANQQSDLIVQIEMRKWNWTFSYPQYGIRLVDAQELVLPVDQRIRFEVDSADIIHSFWIPAFRMKVDAMPGRTNILYATPTETGSFSDDINLRAQCAELCGTGHSRMRAGLRILEWAEFDAWVSEQTEGSP